MRGEKIHTIASLLQKYTRLTAPQGAVVNAFIQAVKDELGAEIGKDALSFNIRARTMHVALGGPLKQELRLHMHAILARTAREIGEKNAPVRII